MTGYPSLSADEEASLLRLARWKTRSWREHPEYEDMLSESYLAAWRSYCRGIDRGPRKALSMATNAAGFGPASWLRTWFGRTSRETSRSRIEFVALSEAAHLPTPGPEEWVLAQLEQERAWELLSAGLARCTPQQRTVLWRLFGRGESQQEVARAMRTSGHAVGMMRDRGLENCRKTQNMRRTPQSEWERYPLCKRGHPQTPENLARMTRGGVFVGTRCRVCGREAMQATRGRQRLRGTDGRETPSGVGSGP